MPVINSSMPREYQLKPGQEPQPSQEGKGLPSNKRVITSKDTVRRAEDLRDGLLGKLADLKVDYLPPSGKLEYYITPLHDEAGKPSAKDRAANLLGKVGVNIKKVVFRQ
jgi:hypothetical protein